MLAGRAVEKIILGSATAGAGGGLDSDLARATALLAEMHQQLGLGDGLLYLCNTSDDRPRLDPLLRSTIAKQLTAIYDQALEIVRRKRAAIEAVAAALIEARFLSEGDLVALLHEEPDSHP